MEFANPKNDVAFRKIFGSEEKTEILISFLNAVLDLEGEKAIQSIQILNPYQTPKIEPLKSTILDVRAKDKRGITFIVEMQVANTVGIRKRFTYYLAKAYVSQLKRSEDYPKLNQVFFIGILDFVMFERRVGDGPGRYLSRHQLLDVETHRQEFTDLEMSFIELPNFTKGAGEVSTLLDKWLYFIKHAEDLEVIPAHVEEAALHSAYETANTFTWSQADLDVYDYHGMRIQDERGAIELAHDVGREEGKLETARNLLAMGLSVEQIAQATGLTVEQITAVVDKGG